MADGEVTVSNVDKPSLEEDADGVDNLTETKQCVSHPKSNVLNEVSIDPSGIQDASTSETKTGTETGAADETVAGTIDFCNEAGAGEEALIGTIDSLLDSGCEADSVLDMCDPRNEGGGGEETILDTGDLAKEVGCGDETIGDNNDTHKEVVVEVALDVTSYNKSDEQTEDKQLEPDVGDETIAGTSQLLNETVPDGGDETIAGQSSNETVPKAAPVSESNIKHGLGIELEAPIGVATADSSQLDGDHSEAVDAIGADIPTREANKELETDVNKSTKTEDDEAASFPAVEVNRELGTDAEGAMEVEDDGAASIPTVDSNREMETDEEDATKAKEDEAAPIPIREANREMEADVEEATEDEEDEAASIPTCEANREMKADVEEATEDEEDEAASIPTSEANRETETSGEEATEVDEDETASIPTVEARQLEANGKCIAKAEDGEAASVPTGEANRELETDGDEEMEAEGRETASSQTGEANRELLADGEDTVKSEDGEAASMLEDSQEDPQYGENEATTAEETATADNEVDTETDAVDSGKGSAGKRKKGKTSKSPATSKTTTRTPTRKVTEEDVCFICFDGGDLVLCDRRGCPKAYHPSCVNRDEAFFRAKGRWNCGWHLCSICEKNAHYMCYTCTYSLCKGCIKSAVILCIRGNKGFCENCMKTVRLIESKQQGDKDINVDFDDKSSWEFLFKDYYMDLKEKLSLSLEEIAEAKSPWKGSDMSGNRHQQAEPQFDNNEDGGSASDNSGEKVEVNRLKRRKITKKSKSLLKEDGMASMSAIAGSEGTSTPSNTEWASRELIDFVKHMKNGDASVLSQFDVQALLLKYIQMNKLRTPNKMSQITCDSRLQSLFGKPRVGHFEMLKLLESHFLIREDSHTDDAHGTVVDTEVEADENRDTLVKEVKDKKPKRKRGNSRGPQSNLDDYAAIDMHNIGLIYVRRKLMEDLLEDVEKFQDKVVGTFVKIRISGNNQKQDLYRLVQVTGTSKASDLYKVGKRTTDIMLEILNLNKKEVISIDTVSNQDFTEDECKRLRQSMKCGLINRPTVGVILDKAMEMHEARVNDWLESEILRITNLRDRASEKGRRKELRECVEKLALLKTPEERQRRLDEIPEIHDDPKMDPSYESEDDDSVTDETRRDVYSRPRDSNFSRRGREPISPRSNFTPKDPYGGGGKMQAKNWESDRNFSSKNTLVKAADSTTHANEIHNENLRGLGRDRDHDYRSSEKLNSTTTETIGRKGHSISRPEMVPGVVSATPTDSGAKINETEKMWRYQDPSGKIQGPFSMVQLRKWNNTGYFPANLRIWRSTEKQDDSILLTDALAGRFQKDSSMTQERERLNPDQNRASPKEKWGGNDSLNLPSPTPKQGNAAPATSFPGDNAISEPSRLVLPSSVSSILASTMNAAGGQPLMSSENASANSSTGFIPMVNTANPQNSQSTPPTVMVHNQDANAHPVQPSNVQNPPNMDANVLGVVPTPQVYGNWGGSITSAVQNLAASFSNTGGALAMPQPEFWMAQTQPNIQPHTMPVLQWGTGMPQNGPAPPNMNVVWGPMQGNPNMGWGGPAPVTMNMNWGAPIVPPPNANAGWVMPTGPLPGNMNPSWGAPPAGNPVVQGMAPANANPGWAAPPVSGPRDNGSQGGDNTGFNDGRSWNRQPSFGPGGGPSRGLPKRQTPCPFNLNGRRCVKGTRCDFLHV